MARKTSMRLRVKREKVIFTSSHMIQVVYDAQAFSLLF